MENKVEVEVEVEVKYYLGLIGGHFLFDMIVMDHGGNGMNRCRMCQPKGTVLDYLNF